MLCNSDMPIWYNVLMINEKTENLRVYYIVVSILAILAIMIGSIDLYLVLNPKEISNNDSTDILEPSKSSTNQSKKSFMELTKEEALSAYKEMKKPGYLPEGYISELVIPSTNCQTMNSLADSYTSDKDIESIFNNDNMASTRQFGNAKFVNDYYAVIFSSPFEYGAAWADDGVASGCLRMFSFNKKYYDYSEDTSPLGVFIDTSTDFVKLALPVLATSSGAMAKLDTIYSYDFDEENDGITLNIHSIGLGYDIDYSDLKAYEKQVKSGTSPQALQFSTHKYRYDYSTKQADWVRDCEGCIFGIRVDRSIPLDNSEVESLLNDTE